MSSLLEILQHLGLDFFLSEVASVEMEGNEQKRSSNNKYFLNCIFFFWNTNLRLKTFQRYNEIKLKDIWDIKYETHFTKFWFVFW